MVVLLRINFSSISKKSYEEIQNIDDKIENRVLEMDSELYDFELNNVEEIEYEFRKMEQTVLNRVEYDKIFWNSFYKRKKGEKTE